MRGPPWETMVYEGLLNFENLEFLKWLEAWLEFEIGSFWAFENPEIQEFY